MVITRVVLGRTLADDHILHPLTGSGQADILCASQGREMCGNVRIKGQSFLNVVNLPPDFLHQPLQVYCFLTDSHFPHNYAYTHAHTHTHTHAHTHTYTHAQPHTHYAHTSTHIMHMYTTLLPQHKDSSDCDLTHSNQINLFHLLPFPSLLCHLPHDQWPPCSQDPSISQDTISDGC